MNKILHFSLIILFFTTIDSSVLHAQSRNLKFGLAGGPSINWLNMKTDDAVSSKTTATFNYGLYTDFKLAGSSNYYFSTGLIIQNYRFGLEYQGASINSSGVVVNSFIEHALQLNYLELPIGLKLRSDEIGYAHIAGWFGLGTAFRLNGNHEIAERFNEGVKAVELNENYNDVSPYSKVSKLSLKIGGEYERKITGETFFVIGATFENGLTNILNGNTFQLDPNTDKADLSKTNTSLSRNGEQLKANLRSIVLHLGVYF